MRKQILNVVVTLSVIAALSIAGFAGLSRNLEANIPFDFMVGGKKLTAGKYIVESGVTPNVLAIRSFKTKQSALSLTRPIDVHAASKPQLIFHRYGNQYFLAKVVSDVAGKELPETKAEREAAKAKRDFLTMKDAEPEIVTVNAQVGQ